MTGPASEDVDIRVQLRNELSGPAAVVTESIKEVGDQARSAARDLEEMDIASRRLRNAQEELALANEAEARSANASAKDKLKASEQVLNAQVRYRSALKTVSTLEDKIANDRRKADQEWTKNNLKVYGAMVKMSDKVKSITKFSFDKLLGTGFKKIGTMFLGVMRNILSVMAKFAYWGAIAVAIFGALALAAPAAGVGLSLFAGSMLAGAQAMGVFKAATSGVMQTVKDMSANIPNMQAIRNDLMNISPGAAQAAGALSNLDRNVLQPLRFSLSDNFFGQFYENLGKLPAIVNAVSGPLQGTARVLGNFVNQLILMLSSSGVLGDLRTLLTGNNNIIASFGQGLVSLLAGLIHFFVVIQPFTQHLADHFADLAARFSAWVQSAQGSPKIVKVFQTVESVMHTLWTMAKNLGGAFFNILHVVAGGFGGFGGDLIKFTKMLDTMTGSNAGQKAMGMFFQSLKPVMGSIVKLVAMLLKLLGQILKTGLIQQLILFATNLLMTLMKNGLNKALLELAQIVLQLVKAIGPDFTTVLVLLVQVLAGLLTVVAKLISWFNKIPGPVRNILVAWIAWKILSAQLITLLVRFAIFAAPLLVDAIASINAALLWLAANPIVLLIAAIVALVVLIGVGIYEMIKHWNAFKVYFSMVFGIFKTIIQVFMAWFNFWFVKPITYAVDAIEMAWNPLKTFFQNFFNGLKSIWMDFVDVVEGVANAVIDVVNVIIRALDTINVKIPDWVPFVGGKSFGINIAQIPKFGNGINALPQQKVPGASNTAGQKNIVAPGNMTTIGGAIAKWAGGAVSKSKLYTVGEKGPELYVPNGLFDKASLIGVNGPHMAMFRESGSIVPNHLLDEYLRRNHVPVSTYHPTSDLSSLVTSTPSRAIRSTITSTSSVTYEGDTLQVVAGNGERWVDIEPKVRLMWNRLQREKKERTIYHAGNPRPRRVVVEKDGE